MAEERVHHYHAEAKAAEGDIQHPLVQKIEPRAYAKLHKTGGYIAESAPDFKLQGVFTFRNAYTQVAGNKDPKPGHGWSTLSTSVVEGLNILDVVTADRVVGQIGTEHPLEGYIPKITFLGTRFENLRIAGHPVEIELDLNLLGAKPGNDIPYLSEPELLARLRKQRKHIHGHQDLPEEIATRYNHIPEEAKSLESFECSLVHQVKGGWPGRSFGHVFDIPDFGKIHLMVLKIEHCNPHPQKGTPQETTFHLNMIEIEMGCIANGTMAIGSTVTNGRTDP